MKTFQLRVARYVTGVEMRELGLYLNISRTIISRWENQKPLDEIKSKKISASSLVFFFKQHGVLFPNDNTVTLDTKQASLQSEHLTRFQLRAARVALSLSQEELANLTNTPKTLINYLEIQKNEIFLNTTNKNVDDLIFKNFFSKNGILFPDSYSICLTG